jgi:hypothetical protein
MLPERADGPSVMGEGRIGGRVSVIEMHDPFFFPVAANEFERDHIADLAAGRCAAIRVSGLLTRAQCDQVLGALCAAPFGSYAAKRVYPPVMRFGVGVSDHRREGKVAETYWSAVAQSNSAWQGLGLPFDPFELCRSAIGAQWPHAVCVGRRGGREMGAGVAREPCPSPRRAGRPSSGGIAGTLGTSGTDCPNHMGMQRM